MKYRTNSEKAAERNRIRRSEEIRSYYDSKPEKRVRKHMNVLKPHLQITVAENYANTEIRQRCAIRVADFGIPVSRASIG